MSGRTKSIVVVIGLVVILSMAGGDLGASLAVLVFMLFILYLLLGSFGDRGDHNYGCGSFLGRWGLRLFGLLVLLWLLPQPFAFFWPHLPGLPFFSGDRGSVTYVALGDSFSSGEGNRPFDDGTNSKLPRNKCHRSSRAYPRVVAEREREIGGVFHIACSGATSQNIDISGQYGELAQVDQLRSVAADRDVDLVTITVGGNDIVAGSKSGFGDIVAECLRHDCTLDHPGGYSARAALASAASTEFLQGIWVTLADVVRESDGATVIPLTYPRVFPNMTQNAGGDPCAGHPIASPLGNLEVTPDEIRFGNLLVATVNNQIEEAARRLNLRALDLEDAFDGHELCTGPVDEQMINQVVTDFGDLTLPQIQSVLANTMHPNRAGNERMADLLQARLRADGIVE